MDVGQDLGPPIVQTISSREPGARPSFFLEPGRDDEAPVLDAELPDIMAALAGDDAGFLALFQISEEPRAFGHVQGEFLFVHRISIYEDIFIY